jgi:hypothetical protein
LKPLTFLGEIFVRNTKDARAEPKGATKNEVGMLENLLGRRRSAPAQFLAVYARLYSFYGTGESLTVVPERGRVSHLGFVESHGSELFGCAPRAEPAAHGQFYTDKFIEINPSERSRPLGSADIKEQQVYDEHYRCSIDFTGLQVDLTLRQAAFEQYKRFIGTTRMPALAGGPGAWHGDLIVLVSAPVFEFPAGRGSAPPYPPAETAQAKVGKLRTIRSFRFDAIDILKTEERAGSGELRVPDISAIPSDQLLRLR